MTEKDESVKQNAESQTEETTENNSEETSNSVENTESNNSQDVETNEEATNKDASNEDDENVDPKDQEIERLQQLANDNEEKYLRLYAEFENYKRRIQNENKINKTYQAQGVLTDILPTIDNIERALQIEGDNDSFKSLQKGVQMVHESLLRALKDNGLEEIESEGQSFDPNVHQAVVQDDNPEYESGVITQELQKTLNKMINQNGGILL